jgi:hypothetical protein
MTFDRFSRRALLVAPVLVRVGAAQAPPQPAPAATASSRGPRIDLALVSDFVGKAHRPDPEAIKPLLTQEPALLNAAWDWGLGDWETALGAAAHTGHREVAMFLLDRGARPDLFAATMLGEIATVKSWLSFAPAAHKSPGPHGIPLLSHAIAGAKPAEPVFHLLLERGANVNAAANNGMTALMMASLGGQAEAVETLLAKGADPRLKSTDGRTAFSIATKAGADRIVRMLRDAGASE